MIDKEKLTAPLNLTKEEIKEAGEMTGFLRIAAFENGAYADGEMKSHQMIVSTAKILKSNPELGSIIRTAVALYEAMEKNQALGTILDLLVSASGKGVEDCTCPACTLWRATKGQNKDEN